ncbi:MAG: malonyl-CoA decarboxylase family protein [Sphingomonadaceae bacterium]
MNAPGKQKAANAGGPRRRNPLERLRNSGIGRFLGRIGRGEKATEGEGLLDLADALLSLRGGASGPALASAFFDLYEDSDTAARRNFLTKVYEQHPRDAAAIDAAILRWQEARDDAAASALNAAAQSPTHKLIRMLNLAPRGTTRLIGMRQDLLEMPEKTPGVKAFDRDLERSFAAWFNAGFLELRRIRWDSPARLLERLIGYEAVHEIKGWEDMRRRVEPVDRRCYGFFHPQMADDPLIFVEVALTPSLPRAIHDIIAEERETISPADASCAIFYSISNCQEGLRGIPFGNYLIKRVVGLLKEELPHLQTFATLSPVPGFAKWMAGDGGYAGAVPMGEELRELAAHYLVSAKHRTGLPRDPVARFHLGNGARLEAIHADADLSANGQKQAHGVMVNYVYDLDEIEANHFALNEMGTVAMSKDVEALAGLGAARVVTASAQDGEIAA